MSERCKHGFRRSDVCPKCVFSAKDALEHQLAEAQGKLDAVREVEVSWCQSRADDVEHTGSTYPSRRGKCSSCGREGPVNDSGRTFRHNRAILGESE